MSKIQRLLFIVFLGGVFSLTTYAGDQILGTTVHNPYLFAMGSFIAGAVVFANVFAPETKEGA